MELSEIGSSGLGPKTLLLLKKAHAYVKVTILSGKQSIYSIPSSWKITQNSQLSIYKDLDNILNNFAISWSYYKGLFLFLSADIQFCSV